MAATAVFFSAVAATAGVLHLRRSRRQTAPRAKREAAHVLVGKVEGQNRGAQPMNPPVAIVDDLHWLRDDSRTSPAVLSHLREENAYTEYKTAHLQPAVTELYTEMLGRMKETDAGIPYLDGTWSYYTRTEKGKSYRVHCRVPQSSSPSQAPTVGQSLSVVAAANGGPLPGEQVVLDENVLAAGHEMCDVASVEMSPDHTLMAYTVDFSGYETYEVRFKAAGGDTPRLGEAVKAAAAAGKEGPVVVPVDTTATGLGDILVDVDGEVVWGADSSTIYYRTFDSAHRPYKVWRHVLGTPQSSDTCLFTEADEKFWVGMGKSKSGAYLFIDSSSKMTSEVHAIRLAAHPAGTPPAVVAADPVGVPRMIAPRTQGVLYEVEHYQPQTQAGASPACPAGFFVITTNAAGAKNFKVCLAPIATPGRDSWVDLLPASKAIKVDGVGVYAHFWAIYGREGGYKNVWLLSAGDVLAFYTACFGSSAASPPRVADGSPCAVDMLRIPPRDSVYVLSGSGGNEVYGATSLRFKYGGPTTPETTCEIDVKLAGLVKATAAAATVAPAVGSSSWAGNILDAPGLSITILKQKEVPNCEPWRYATARVWATSKDGTRVPISIVYRPDAHGLPALPKPEGGAATAWTVPVVKGATTATGAAEAASAAPAPSCPLPAPAPTLLYGYGSYGHSIDLWFSSSVLSLVDRGMVYAVAHIRGGGEMGRAWYEDEGKLMTKQNTFDDFIHCGEHLLATGWTAKGRLGAMGASAGGLLMGVVLNTRPDLWGAIVSQVGFVDVIQSVADPTIPLAVTEWEEWGNPNEAEAFAYMKSYSPLDNVRQQAVPKTLLTAGLNDSRVAYWEPAKYAQRLRDANTGPNDVLLKTDMGAGHFSYSDRYAYLKDKAFEYAWLMEALGVPVKGKVGGKGE